MPVGNSCPFVSKSSRILHTDLKYDSFMFPLKCKDEGEFLSLLTPLVEIGFGGGD